MTFLMNMVQVLSSRLTFSLSTVQNPTCSMGPLMCGCVPALPRLLTLFRGVMHEIHANNQDSSKFEFTHEVWVEK
jgi:hypothetical protein